MTAVEIYPWQGAYIIGGAVRTAPAGVQRVNNALLKGVAIYKKILVPLVDHYLADGLVANYRVKYGSVVWIILEIAEAENVDLIAMAAHGWTGLSRVLYGTVGPECSTESTDHYW